MCFLQTGEMQFPYSNMMQHVQITGHPRRLQIFFLSLFSATFSHLACHQAELHSEDFNAGLMVLEPSEAQHPDVEYVAWIGCCCNKCHGKVGPIAIAAIAGG